MSRLAQLIAREMGIKTRERINPFSAICGVAAKVIAPQNPDRVALIIANLSANNVFVGFDNQVSSTKGIFLAPNGGNLSMNYREDFGLVGREIWGIASADNSAIYVVEIIVSGDVV